MGILESELIIRRFLFGLGIGFGGGLEGLQLEVKPFRCGNYFFQAFAKLFLVVFAQRASRVLVQIVVDLIYDGGEIF